MSKMRVVAWVKLLRHRTLVLPGGGGLTFHSRKTGPKKEEGEYGNTICLVHSPILIFIFLCFFVPTTLVKIVLR